MNAQHTPARRWKAWEDANITCEGVQGHVAECSTAERAREIVDALNANDELARDAARYRWLRDVSVPPHNFYISVPDEFVGVRYAAQEVDAYIDAAIAKSGSAT